MTHIVHVGGSEDSTLLVMDLGNAALASLQQLQVLTGKWGGGMKPQVEVWTVDEWAEWAVGWPSSVSMPDNFADQTAPVQQLLVDAYGRAHKAAAGHDNNSIGLFQQVRGGWSR